MRVSIKDPSSCSIASSYGCVLPELNETALQLAPLAGERSIDRVVHVGTQANSLGMTATSRRRRRQEAEAGEDARSDAGCQWIVDGGGGRRRRPARDGKLGC
jgi:hypothetical protein